MKIKALVLLLLCTFATPITALAQDKGAPAAVEQDPTDEIVTHIDAMTAIVKDNMTEPEKVKAQIKAYIDEQGEAMKRASDRFESKLSSLSVDEAESYRETLQRKIEGSMEQFFAAMLEFSERHPEAAKELDELLKKAE